MTRGDAGIIGAVLALLVGSLLVAAAPNVSASHAVLRGPQGVTRISLEHDAVYVVEGDVGRVVFEVSDSTLRCVKSDCSDHVCVNSGACAPGRPIVCAPNRVVATIEGAREGGLDAVSR